MVNNFEASHPDLDILFFSEKDAYLFSSYSLRVRKFGEIRAKLIGRRLDDLHAVDTLADMRNLPGRCHELRENRKGTLSVDLDGPYRLIFQPANDPIITKPDGGLDWSAITLIKVLGVENTHGK